MAKLCAERKKKGWFLICEDSHLGNLVLVTWRNVTATKSTAFVTALPKMHWLAYTSPSFLTKLLRFKWKHMMAKECLQRLCKPVQAEILRDAQNVRYLLNATGTSYWKVVDTGT